MEAIECIRTRRSIRGFRPDPVSKDILREVVETAMWSPSYKNSQPWEIMILSGGKKEELSKIMVELHEKGTSPCPDSPATAFRTDRVETDEIIIWDE